MRRGWFTLLFGVVALLSDLAVGPAWGAEKAKGTDIFELRADLGVWTIVVFLALLFILKRYAWGPILEGLHKREDSIRGALAEAENARTEAGRIRGELQSQLDRASEKVAQIMEAGRRDAERLSADLTNKARTEIQAERERLRREIELARDQALHELWAQSAQLATLISAKAIGRSLSEADHHHLVDEALADLRTAGNARQQPGAGVRA